jgi:hypothetical protein
MPPSADACVRPNEPKVRSTDHQRPCLRRRNAREVTRKVAGVDLYGGLAPHAPGFGGCSVSDPRPSSGLDCRRRRSEWEGVAIPLEETFGRPIERLDRCRYLDGVDAYRARGKGCRRRGDAGSNARAEIWNVLLRTAFGVAGVGSRVGVLPCRRGAGVMRAVTVSEDLRRPAQAEDGHRDDRQDRSKPSSSTDRKGHAHGGTVRCQRAGFKADAAARRLPIARTLE